MKEADLAKLLSKSFLACTLHRQPPLKPTHPAIFREIQQDLMGLLEGGRKPSGPLDFWLIL